MRSRAIKNSDYQWYFYVVKCNFNEKRLNDISIGNILNSVKILL